MMRNYAVHVRGYSTWNVFLHIFNWPPNTVWCWVTLHCFVMVKFNCFAQQPCSFLQDSSATEPLEINVHVAFMTQCLCQSWTWPNAFFLSLFQRVLFCRGQWPLSCGGDSDKAWRLKRHFFLYCHLAWHNAAPAYLHRFTSFIARLVQSVAVQRSLDRIQKTKI